MTRDRVALRSADPPILVCADIQAQYLGHEGIAGR